MQIFWDSGFLAPEFLLLGSGLPLPQAENIPRRYLRYFHIYQMDKWLLSFFDRNCA